MSKYDNFTMEATPAQETHRILTTPEKKIWQQAIEFLILAATFFRRSKSDPVLKPNRKLSQGEWGRDFFRFMRVYGDDLFLYYSLFIVFILWLVATFSPIPLYAENRALSIMVTALLIVLMTEQWKALPLRWLSLRVEKMQTIKMSTVTWVMSVSSSLPGSIFDLRSKKLVILPIIVALTHGPDLLAGVMTEVSKSGANGLNRKVDFTLGPVAGGIRGGPRFYQSGLKFLSRDTEEEDLLVMSFNKKLSTAYVPHMPQELYSSGRGLSFIRAEELPVYRLRRDGTPAKFGADTKFEICRNSEDANSAVLWMGAFTKGNCIIMGVKYEPNGEGRAEAFSEEIELCRGTMKVDIEKTDLGPVIRKVSNYQDGGPIGEIERIQDGTHKSCEGFSNILSFGISNNRKVADIQSVRLAVAWLVRSATTNSSTGYGAESFKKGPGYGRTSSLRYKLPNWADWIIIIFVSFTLISQGAFVLYHSAALPRSFDTAAIHCGRVLSQHTTRCATRDWKYMSGQKDKSDDFTVQFGMKADSNGNVISSPTTVQGLDKQVGAVHLEWGLPGEVIPVGFVSARTSHRFNPAYVGAGSMNESQGIESEPLNQNETAIVKQNKENTLSNLKMTFITDPRALEKAIFSPIVNYLRIHSLSKFKNVITEELGIIGAESAQNVPPMKLKSYKLACSQKEKKCSTSQNHTVMVQGMISNRLLEDGKKYKFEIFIRDKEHTSTRIPVCIDMKVNSVVHRTEENTDTAEDNRVSILLPEGLETVMLQFIAQFCCPGPPDIETPPATTK